MHIPVLYTESIDALNITPDGVYVDGTLGGAGHAAGIAEKLSPRGTLIGFDVDSQAIARAHEKLDTYPCTVKIFHENFRNLVEILTEQGIVSVDGVLLDLGWSSYQIADGDRGFSFQIDGPLHMTLRDNPDAESITASDIINTWSEETLADIFYGYGDETAARLIAKKIVAARRDVKFTTTLQLADFIKQVIPFRKGKTHPATKVFQALRIAVNDEYGALVEILERIIPILKPGGRLAIITFHSGEDRIVKNTFRDLSEAGMVNIITKKPIVPDTDELDTNIRARSAKLRILEKL